MVLVRPPDQFHKKRGKHEEQKRGNKSEASTKARHKKEQKRGKAQKRGKKKEGAKARQAQGRTARQVEKKRPQARNEELAAGREAIHAGGGLTGGAADAQGQLSPLLSIIIITIITSSAFDEEQRLCEAGAGTPAGRSGGGPQISLPKHVGSLF